METFDSGLNRSASCLPQQIKHVRLPEIDARLDAEFHFSFYKRFQKRAVGQEYFVYKIYISDARGDQAVDLLQHDVQIPPPVAVAKIDLGAEAAMIGTAARGFHLRTRDRKSTRLNT